jgi:hypothetical protein
MHYFMSTSVACLPEGYQLDITESLYGHGNGPKCLSELSAALFPRTRCNVHPCVVNGVYQPSLNPRVFYAYSGFTYTTNFLNLTGHVRVAELQHAGIRYLKSPWHELKSRFPNVPEKYLCKYGFDAIYMSLLLTHLGFGNQSSRVIFQSKVALHHGGSMMLGWPLGAMIYEASRSRFHKK